MIDRGGPDYAYQKPGYNTTSVVHPENANFIITSRLLLVVCNGHGSSAQFNCSFAKRSAIDADVTKFWF